jgi:hypothetical protein
MSHILVCSPHYGEAHHLYHLHEMLPSMLGDDCHSVSNVLAFLSAVGLARAIAYTVLGRYRILTFYLPVRQ